MDAIDAGTFVYFYPSGANIFVVRSRDEKNKKQFGANLPIRSFFSSTTQTIETVFNLSKQDWFTSEHLKQLSRKLRELGLI